MNWNGQRPSVEHFINLLSQPDKTAALQADFNTKRRARVQSALNTRPLFLPLKYQISAAGQTTPYRDTTPSLAFSVLITGFKTDTPTRDIVIRRTEDEKPIIYVGEQQNLFLRADEIAGSTASVGGGQLGVFYLPQPIILPAGNRLTIEMFKTDGTADPEQANIVLVGIRVFNQAFGQILLDSAENQLVENLIALRESPRIVFLKSLVNFDSAVAGGQAKNIFTPQVPEPLLIRGIRTTLRHSALTIRIQGEPNWTVKPTPIWGIAAENELVHENYQWFSKPIFLHSSNTIEIETITNSIDGSLIDPQTGNTITWLCETV